jgi:hypothetical protein
MTHRIDQAVVQGGRVTVSGLELPDGERVQVIVKAPEVSRRTIAEVREMLRGSVVRFDEPCEPMIPSSNWEMLG